MEKTDAFATFSGLEVTLEKVKEILPDLTELYLSSDNAPNYHNNDVSSSIFSLDCNIISFFFLGFVRHHSQAGHQIRYLPHLLPFQGASGIMH